jgi:hypothetical protein
MRAQLAAMYKEVPVFANLEAVLEALRWRWGVD